MFHQTFQTLPKPQETYGNIIKSLLPIGANKAKNVDKNRLPDMTYSVESLQINQSHLAEYRRVCGFSFDNLIPPTYFAVLSQTLQMNMMAQPSFPFAILGLVHIENMVTQYRPISDHTTVKMDVSFANLQDHDKGKQFDFVTKVYEKDELVWEGTSTYLVRQKKPVNHKKPPSDNTKPSLDENDIHHFWDIPENIGRRYAKISGDFNLIHIHGLTAKAFGFKQAVAHGMWTKAKCLAQLGNLPKSYRITVSFKLPIFLPSEVEYIAKYDNRDEHIDFGLYDVKTPKPHLIGHLENLTV